LFWKRKTRTGVRSDALGRTEDDVEASGDCDEACDEEEEGLENRSWIWCEVKKCSIFNTQFSTLNG